MGAKLAKTSKGNSPSIPSSILHALSNPTIAIVVRMLANTPSIFIFPVPSKSPRLEIARSSARTTAQAIKISHTNLVRGLMGLKVSAVQSAASPITATAKRVLSTGLIDEAVGLVGQIAAINIVVKSSAKPPIAGIAPTCVFRQSGLSTKPSLGAIVASAAVVAKLKAIVAMKICRI